MWGTCWNLSCFWLKILRKYSIFGPFLTQRAYCCIRLGICIYAFDRRFNPNRLALHFKVHIYSLINSCFPWETNPWPWRYKYQRSTVWTTGKLNPVFCCCYCCFFQSLTDSISICFHYIEELFLPTILILQFY